MHSPSDNGFGLSPEYSLHRQDSRPYFSPGQFPRPLFLAKRSGWYPSPTTINCPSRPDSPTRGTKALTQSIRASLEIVDNKPSCAPRGRQASDEPSALSKRDKQAFTNAALKWLLEEGDVIISAMLRNAMGLHIPGRATETAAALRGNLDPERRAKLMPGMLPITSDEEHPSKHHLWLMLTIPIGWDLSRTRDLFSTWSWSIQVFFNDEFHCLARFDVGRHQHGYSIMTAWPDRMLIEPDDVVESLFLGLMHGFSLLYLEERAGHRVVREYHESKMVYRPKVVQDFYLVAEDDDGEVEWDHFIGVIAPIRLPTDHSRLDPPEYGSDCPTDEQLTM